MARFPSAHPSDRSDGGSVRKGAAAVVERAGDQRNAVADGRELAWISRDAGVERLERCRRRPNGDCEVEIVVEGDQVPRRIWLERGWLVWTHTGGGPPVVMGCPLGPRRPSCTPWPLLDAPAEDGWVVRSFDGRSLLLEASGRHALCEIRGSDGRCAPEALDLGPSLFSLPVDPVHDGRLIAYFQAGAELDFPPGCAPDVFTEECIPSVRCSGQYCACWLDETLRRCEGFPVSSRVPLEHAHGAAVSRSRVVWSVGSGIERPSVHFCEIEARRSECAGQRITGHPAAARAPALDGTRVVWEDGRSGPPRIWGIELPSLHVPRHWRARAGLPFSIPWVGSAGSSGILRIEVDPLVGDALPNLEVRSTPVATGKNEKARGRIAGRVPATASGSVLWRVRLLTTAGLVSERTIEIDVLPAAPRRIPYRLFDRLIFPIRR